MRALGFGGLVLLVTWTSGAGGQAPAVVDATAAAERTPQPVGEPAVVSVGTTGDGVILAKILNRSVATGYSSGYSVTLIGITYKDLCTLPCTVKLDPGINELSVYGPGMTTATERFNLTSGRHYMEVRPGSAALLYGGYIIAALGFTATLFGGIFLAIDVDDYGGWAIPTTIGGVAALGGGIGMMFAGATAFEKVPAPPSPSASMPLMLKYRGTL